MTKQIPCHSEAATALHYGHREVDSFQEAVADARHYLGMGRATVGFATRSPHANKSEAALSVMEDLVDMARAIQEAKDAVVTPDDVATVEGLTAALKGLEADANRLNQEALQG